MQGGTTDARRIAVYTCITGGYDRQPQPSVVDPRFDYFCFTDDPSTVAAPWTPRPIGLSHLRPKDQNRYIKMHPHEVLPEYEVTIYLDGNLQIVGDAHAVVSRALQQPEDVFAYDHFCRKCVYDEAAFLSEMSHDWVWKFARQMRRYRAHGYPRGLGLFDASVMIRRNTPRMRELMSAWWNEYRAGVSRDQISLPWVAWRQGIPVGSLGINDRFHTQLVFRAVDHAPRRFDPIVTLRKYINRLSGTLFSYDRLFGR